MIRRATFKDVEAFWPSIPVLVEAMNALFAKRGWRLAGTLNFSDASVDFNAWEKPTNHARS